MPNKRKPKKLITGNEGELSSTRLTPGLDNSDKDNNPNKQEVTSKTDQKRK